MGISCLALPSIPLCLTARTAARSRREHPVRRAPYRSRPMIQDVRVDHSHAQPLGQGMIAEPAHLGNARRTERYGDAESGQGGHPAPRRRHSASGPPGPASPGKPIRPSPKRPGSKRARSIDGRPSTIHSATRRPVGGACWNP